MKTVAKRPLNRFHKKILKEAGFKLINEDRDYNSPDWNYARWKRGDIILVFQRDEPVNVSLLVKRLVDRVIYTTISKAYVEFKYVDFNENYNGG